MTCKYFLPFCGLYFHFLDGGLWNTKFLNFGEVESLSHKWGLNRREPRLLATLAWGSAPAAAIWGQDKKCQSPSSPQGRGRGWGALCFWLHHSAQGGFSNTLDSAFFVNLHRFILFIYLFILAVPRGMCDLSSPVGGNPLPLQWKHKVLTTGPPGNSQHRSWIAMSSPICPSDPFQEL